MWVGNLLAFSTMHVNFRFDANMLESLVGGRSILDLEGLKIQNLDQAYNFLRAYGFDMTKAADEKQLWTYLRRAVTYIQTELLIDGEVIPEVLSDPNKLQNIANILMYASIKDDKNNSMQKWSCAILKVMHVLVHLDNDLFTQHSIRIQEQILETVRHHIVKDPIAGTFLGHPSDPDHVALKKFVVKSFKSSTSSITKLLAKPEAVAFTLLDKIGIRFVTKHLFDVFRVMRFLINHNLISFPHNIPDQSNNTLYPINLFLEVMETYKDNDDVSLEDIDKTLLNKLNLARDRAEYTDKLNIFSSKDYRFMKFITRKLIKMDWPQEGSSKSKELNFFYPFEVQIIDYQTYLQNISGEASHEKYKERQKKRARTRVLGKDSL